MTPEEWTAVRLSLLVATTATAASLPFGVAIAWLLARGRFWGKGLLDTLVHLPLILPPVVTGYLLLISFGRKAPVGAFLAEELGIVFAFRWTGAALACGIMGFPLMVRAIHIMASSRFLALPSCRKLLWLPTVFVNPIPHNAGVFHSLPFASKSGRLSANPSPISCSNRSVYGKMVCWLKKPNSGCVPVINLYW